MGLTTQFKGLKAQLLPVKPMEGKRQSAEFSLPFCSEPLGESLGSQENWATHPPGSQTARGRGGGEEGVCGQRGQGWAHIIYLGFFWKCREPERTRRVIPAAGFSHQPRLKKANSGFRTVARALS